MEWTEQEIKLIEKADFYRENEIKVHVYVIPKGKFKNGLFASKIQEGRNGKFYWWFIENGSSIPIRLFLFETYEMIDYKEEIRGEDETTI